MSEYAAMLLFTICTTSWRRTRASLLCWLSRYTRLSASLTLLLDGAWCCVLFIIVVTLMHGIGVAIFSCVVAYQTESIAKGLKWMFVVIRQYDGRTNGVLREPNTLGRHTTNRSIFDWCASRCCGCRCGRDDEEMQYYLDRMCLTA